MQEAESDIVGLPYPESFADRTFQDIYEFGVKLQEVPTRTLWFRNLLVCILNALLREYRILKLGAQEVQPMMIAWACRNLLELKIITKYTLLNGTNAKRFVDEQVIDSIEFFSAAQAFLTGLDSKKAGCLDDITSDLREQKKRLGISTAGFVKVGDMAVSVGLSSKYRHMAKFTSKLVHPTAFSVILKSDEGEFEALKPICFVNAVSDAADAFAEIRSYVTKNGVEPI